MGNLVIAVIRRPARRRRLLAIGVCAAVAHAQQARPRAGAREVALPVILSIEDDRASTRADLDVLLGALRGQLAPVATRALGRLERRDVITDLLPFLAAEGNPERSGHGARPGAPRPRSRRRSSRPAGARRSRSPHRFRRFSVARSQSRSASIRSPEHSAASRTRMSNRSGPQRHSCAECSRSRFRSSRMRRTSRPRGASSRWRG